MLFLFQLSKIDERKKNPEIYSNNFRCTIKMCLPNVQYQRINPTTQAVVTSECLTCENAVNTVIEWNVYSGFQSGYPNNDIQWILYPNMDAYENILFYGKNN